MITLHSDDYGYDSNTDGKILHLIKEGKIKSVSVLSTMATGYSLIALSECLKKTRGVSVALHVNLTEKKLFLSTIKIILGLTSQREIRNEIKKQLAVLKTYDIKVNSLDSHQHIHALSPVAEIIKDIARKEKIKKIRTYKNVDNKTFIAKVKFTILKIVSALSYFKIYKKVGLPISWKMEGNPITVMSWEGKRLNIAKILNANQTFIIHPYLPFDSNLSYSLYL